MPAGRHRAALGAATRERLLRISTWNLVAAGGESLLPVSSIVTAGATDRFLCSFHPLGTIQLAVSRPAPVTAAIFPALVIGLTLAGVSFAVTRVVAHLD